MSVCDPKLAVPIQPSFPLAKRNRKETTATKIFIDTLNLQPHPEGGYFVETDRDPLRVLNPFRTSSASTSSEGKDDQRNASTTIYYFLTPRSPQGGFHRNKGRTVHTLHRGRGRYVIIHADQIQHGGKARIETFVVGQDIEKGERVQWIVEGGKYKASFLLPDNKDGSGGSEGLLISETVIPGFEFRDHNFLPRSELPVLVTEEQARELDFLVHE
ncbi:MAG: hypothetical protein Q9190_006678 [Brigantiaea leucoxantha]